MLSKTNIGTIFLKTSLNRTLVYLIYFHISSSDPFDNVDLFLASFFIFNYIDLFFAFLARLVIFDIFFQIFNFVDIAIKVIIVQFFDPHLIQTYFYFLLFLCLFKLVQQFSSFLFKFFIIIPDQLDLQQQ